MRSHAPRINRSDPAKVDDMDPIYKQIQVGYNTYQWVHLRRSGYVAGPWTSQIRWTGRHHSGRLAVKESLKVQLSWLGEWLGRSIQSAPQPATGIVVEQRVSGDIRAARQFIRVCVISIYIYPATFSPNGPWQLLVFLPSSILPPPLTLSPTCVPPPERGSAVIAGRPRVPVYLNCKEETTKKQNREGPPSSIPHPAYNT